MGPTHTIRQVSHAMAGRKVRAAVVLDPDDVLGVLSVRDVVRVWSSVRASTSA